MTANDSAYPASVTDSGLGPAGKAEDRTDSGPPPPTDCDLIMQGGVTSGVAYPAAIMQLYRKYRFRSIGGASAGAIAASITAAAEYARDDGGFDRLDEVRAELRTPGLLVQLFRPTREARPALRMLLGAQARRTTGAKAITYLRELVWWLLAPVLLTVAAVFCAGAVLIGGSGGSAARMSPLGWALFAVALLGSGALALIISLAVSVYRLLVVHLPGNFYGMCLGKSESRDGKDALTDWLHAKIQYVANRPPDLPLTFGELAERGVQLKMMTTDVSWGRPVRMPDHGRSGVDFHFHAGEFAALFPDELVASMARAADADPGHPELRALPDSDLPVLVATRMSLAFPLFLASVPLWSVGEDGAPRRHWFSDGGITSNFPIHFFDSWLPTRPTFGLNFVPSAQSVVEPQNPSGHADSAIADAVGYYPDGRPPIRFAGIRGVGGYLAQVLDAMHNWHDTMQSELPGFSDRIAHIELADAEGGFNITMPPGDPADPQPGTVARVEAKGAAAGRKLAGFDFRRHWLRRYTGTFRLLQGNLAVSPNGTDVTVASAFTPEYRAWLAAGAPGAGPPDGRDLAWCQAAADATGRLVTEVDGWLPNGSGSFVDGAEPLPPSVMRSNPDV